MRIHAFRAVRPTEKLASRVASVPYDVVDREEAAALARNNPDSFLRVARAEIELPPETDPYSDAVYRKARENFEALRQRGSLVPEAEPSLYIYRLQTARHAQHGVVAGCHVFDYEKDVIKKHEKTRLDKEADRTRHIAELNAHTGLVFLTYRDQSDVDRLVKAVEAQPPLFDFKTDDGVAHTLWRVSKPEPLIRAFRKIPAAYIADGHHRAASAVSVARARRAAHSGHDANAEYNWFPAGLFPASQLKILPYNRCVKDLNGRDAAGFLAAVGARFQLTENADPAPAQAGHISMYLGKRWFDLGWSAAGVADPVSALDVSVLQARLLGPVLGIGDPRTDKRIEFISGIRGTEELERRVKSGAAAVAFSMFPTTVEQMLAIADAGQSMPPKSTWFEPKLRSGLLTHVF